MKVALIASGPTSDPCLTQLVERGIPGHEIVALPTSEALTGRRYDLVHVGAPGPGGIAAASTARAIGLPVIGSYAADAPVYGQCRVVLSPSHAADRSLDRLGVPPERIARWSPGVDPERFSPARYDPDILPDAFNVLYAGPISREHGVDLLAEAFLVARDRDPRLHLVLAGAGTGRELELLRARVCSAAMFLGPLDGVQLAGVYATADLFVSPGTTDAPAQAILEAQASGLPVLAVDGGGSAELIEGGRSGCLVAPEPGIVAGAIRGLGRRGALRERLATGGLLAVQERSWERSLAELAAAYVAALQPPSEVARAA